MELTGVELCISELTWIFSSSHEYPLESCTRSTRLATIMHLLACVPNYTLKGRVEINPHAANLHRLPNSPDSKVPNGLLVTYSRHYSSAQTESRYCCQEGDQVLEDSTWETMSTLTNTVLQPKVSRATQNINLWTRARRRRDPIIVLTQAQEPRRLRPRSG